MPVDNAPYLSIGQVAARLAVSRCTLYRWIAAGGFPAGHQFSAGCRRWWLADVQAWEASRATRIPAHPANTGTSPAQSVTSRAA